MSPVLILAAASVFSIAAPLGAGIVTIRRLRPEMKILMGLFVAAALVEGYTFYQAMNSTGSHFAHHLYAPVEYTLLILAFSYWQENGVFKKAILSSIPVFIIICVANIGWGGGWNSLNIFTRSLANTVYIVIASYSLLTLLRRDSGLIYRDFRFWICSGVLIYSSGSLVYFALHDLMPVDVLVIIWYIHNGLNIAANIMYATGFICQYNH